MNHQDELRLQAFLDGELPEKEAREVAVRLEQAPEAAALFAELRQTRTSLRGSEAELKVPEARAFYWSRIERELQRLPESRPAPMRVPWFEFLRGLLKPATSVALVALLGLIIGRQFVSTNSSALAVETTMGDSGAFTYHDYSAGATIVWVSYPADNDLAVDADPDTL